MGKLSTLDRFLPVWIGVAMVAGLLLGRVIPGLDTALSAVEVQGVSLPIALGLLIMMYPVLAKVRYDRLDAVTSDRRLLGTSLVLNWVVGPLLMFALAWVFLPDLPTYRTGLIIVGLARCIAMVIIWNDLACGDREAAAVLVAINSVFQVIMFAVLGWFYLSVLPGWLGLHQEHLNVSPWKIAGSVLVFLGIPLLAGYLSRRLGERAKGRTKPIAFEVIIESAAGISHVEEIAAASPRLQAMSLGAADFAASMGMATTGIGGTQENYYMAHQGQKYWADPWHWAQAAIVAACRTHGVLPVDGPFGDFSDQEGFRAQALRSATLGMVRHTAE